MLLIINWWDSSRTIIIKNQKWATATSSENHFLPSIFPSLKALGLLPSIVDSFFWNSFLYLNFANAPAIPALTPLILANKITSMIIQIMFGTDSSYSRRLGSIVFILFCIIHPLKDSPTLYPK